MQANGLLEGRLDMPHEVKQTSVYTVNVSRDRRAHFKILPVLGHGVVQHGGYCFHAIHTTVCIILTLEETKYKEEWLFNSMFQEEVGKGNTYSDEICQILQGSSGRVLRG
jgi:hypothetical protein